jgi:hypothetical protein
MGLRLHFRPGFEKHCKAMHGWAATNLGLARDWCIKGAQIGNSDLRVPQDEGEAIQHE